MFKKFFDFDEDDLLSEMTEVDNKALQKKDSLKVNSISKEVLNKEEPNQNERQKETVPFSFDFDEDDLLSEMTEVDKQDLKEQDKNPIAVSLIKKEVLNKEEPHERDVPFSFDFDEDDLLSEMTEIDSNVDISDNIDIDKKELLENTFDEEKLLNTINETEEEVTEERELTQKEKIDLENSKLDKDTTPKIQSNIEIEDLLIQEAEKNILNYEESQISKNNETIILENSKDNSETEITLNNGQTVEDFLISKRKRKIKQKKVYVTAPEVDTLEENRIKLDKPEPLDKFMKANGKPIGYEKQILKSLGITSEELKDLVAPSSSLSDFEKAKLLSVGYFGTDKRKEKGTQKKFVNTGDKDILMFLDVVKLATTKHLSTMTGKTTETINVNMGRLHRMGIVSKVQAYGTQIVWALTQTGHNLIGSEKKPVSSKLYEPLALAERFYVNHIIASLWNNKVNVLGLEDFPAKNRNTEKGKVQGENIISESEIYSSLSSKLIALRGFEKDKFKGESLKKLSDEWEIEWRNWEREGKNIEGPELIKGNEYLYALFSPSIMTASYILPDIVVVRDRNKDGSPNSIAIEVEKMVKSVDEYIKKLTVYKEDDRLYGKVIYITPNKKTAENVKEAAEIIGFDRYDIMPMLDKNGELTTEKNGWLI